MCLGVNDSGSFGKGGREKNDVEEKRNREKTKQKTWEPVDSHNKYFIYPFI